MDTKLEDAIARITAEKDAASKAHWRTLTVNYGDLETNLTEQSDWLNVKIQYLDELEVLRTIFSREKIGDVVRKINDVGILLTKLSSARLDSVDDPLEDLEPKIKQKEEQQNVFS